MDVDYTAAAVTTAGGAVVLGPAVLSDRRQGWTAGGGIEVGFADNWSAKIEYNYLDFGTDRYTFIAPGATATTSADTHVHMVKGGINYRFNWGGQGGVTY
jgi:outer membrane immunogenic protein